MQKAFIVKPSDITVSIEERVARAFLKPTPQNWEIAVAESVHKNISCMWAGGNLFLKNAQPFFQNGGFR
jgi:hypothetical protein